MTPTLMTRRLIPHTLVTDRRSVLLGAVAGMAVGWRGARAAQPVGPVMERLSGYMAAAASTPLPGPALEAAKLHILDTLGAMVSGATLRPGKLAITFARAYGGEKVATVVASDVVVGPIEAALANGILAHSDETDDSHAPSTSHPGAPVVAATLAAGEKFGVDGARFVRAVALGYDIGTRMTMTLGRDFTAGHKSTHAVAGGFGTAAAAACCAGLNEQQMRWLLDYTAQQSAGIASWQRDRDHIEKAFVFAGMAARNGVNAALLVQAGWTGVDDVLSGADNFFAAYGPQADPAKLTEGLGSRFEIERTNIKKWTVGSPIQAPLDALWNLLQAHHFKPDDVAEITVRVSRTEASVVNNRDIPDICLQHMIAVMLIDGTASFAAAHDVERMEDPEVLRQRAKVTLVPDDELEKRLPAREATVEVLLTDKQHFSEHVSAVRGTAQNPMTQDEVVAKCRDLMTPVLGAERCDTLIRLVLSLETQGDLRAMRPLLRVG
jgi:2-methylcitrate dehydratase PrpD